MDTTDNEKFNQIIRTARELFWRHGIKRVTIEEICQEAQVSKATFYKHFANKTELVKKILDWFGQESMVKYDRIMAMDIPYKEKMKKLIGLKKEQTDNMSSAFYDDYALHTDPELKEHLDQHRGEYLQRVLKDYNEAQKRGDIRQDIKPEFILYIINFMFSHMGNDEQLVAMYETPQDLAVELLNFFLYGIMPRDKD